MYALEFDPLCQVANSRDVYLKGKSMGRRRVKDWKVKKKQQKKIISLWANIEKKNEQLPNKKKWHIIQIFFSFFVKSKRKWNLHEFFLKGN